MNQLNPIEKLKQDLRNHWIEEYNNWFLNEIIERFPGEHLRSVIKKVEVQRWPNHTVLLEEGVPFAIWKDPQFKIGEV